MKPVLFVDLDESLVKTDILREQLVRSLALNFWQTLKLLFTARFQPERVKDAICQKIDIDPATLPYNTDVLNLVRQAKGESRTVVLATATHEKVAHQIAQYLDIFDGVLATTRHYNCKGKNKLAWMQAYAGSRPFDYIGDSKADLAIFPHCQMPVIVGNLPYANAHRRLSRPPIFKTLLNILHSPRWVKNILIFIPLVFSQHIDSPACLAALTGFISFSLAASGIYIINDMANVEDDRHNPQKKKGSFAKGDLTIDEGLITALLFLSVAILLSYLLKPATLWILGAYALLKLPAFFCTQKFSKLSFTTTWGLRILYALNIFQL